MLARWWFDRWVKNGGYAAHSKSCQQADLKKYMGKFAEWRGILRPVHASMLVNLIRWRKDEFKELFDAFHHPVVGDVLIGKVLKANDIDPKCLRDGYPHNPNSFAEIIEDVDGRKGQDMSESFDCDDFGLWCAMAVQAIYRTKILCVAWKKGFWPWQVGGHNVCLFQEGNKLGYIGNWPMRYGFRSVHEVVSDVLAQVGRSDLDLVGYHEWEPKELVLTFPTLNPAAKRTGGFTPRKKGWF